MCGDVVLLSANLDTAELGGLYIILNSAISGFNMDSTFLIHT